MACAIRLIVALACAMALADVIIITDDVTVVISDVHSDNVCVRQRGVQLVKFLNFRAMTGSSRKHPLFVQFPCLQAGHSRFRLICTATATKPPHATNCHCLSVCLSTHGQTDRQTDRQTAGETDEEGRFTGSLVHSMGVWGCAGKGRRLCGAHLFLSVNQSAGPPQGCTGRLCLQQTSNRDIEVHMPIASSFARQDPSIAMT
jgi:hypothetical protein